jgi:hypothetical protein
VGTLRWSGALTIGQLDSITGVLRATTLGEDSVTVISSINSITATSGPIRVTSAALARVVIAPKTDTIPAESTLAMTYTGYDQYGNALTSLAGYSFAWRGGNGFDTLTGLLHDTVPGLDTIIITNLDSNFADTAFITIIPGNLVRLAITPSSVHMTVGQETTFTAAGYDRYGNEVTALGAITWDTLGSIGTLTGNRFTAVRSGRGNIRAAAGSVFGLTDSIVVVQPLIAAPVLVSPDSGSIVVRLAASSKGVTKQFVWRQGASPEHAWGDSIPVIYQIELSGDAAFSNAAQLLASTYLNVRLDDDSTRSAIAIRDVPLLANQTIPVGRTYWRVRAVDTTSSAVGEKFYSDYSQVWCFEFAPKTGVQSVNVTPPIVTPYSHNPEFNKLRLSFALARPARHITVNIFNMEGYKIASLTNNGVDIKTVDGQANAYEAIWKCIDWRQVKVPGGLYIYQIEADNNPIINGTFGVAK